jgi:hypothetical protein
MIEGAVFLHQDDDMFDIPDASGTAIGGHGQGALDQRGPGAERKPCLLQEFPAISVRHDGIAA